MANVTGLARSLAAEKGGWWALGLSSPLVAGAVSIGIQYIFSKWFAEDPKDYQAGSVRAPKRFQIGPQQYILGKQRTGGVVAYSRGRDWLQALDSSRNRGAINRFPAASMGNASQIHDSIIALSEGAINGFGSNPVCYVKPTSDSLGVKVELREYGAGELSWFEPKVGQPYQGRIMIVPYFNGGSNNGPTRSLSGFFDTIPTPPGSMLDSLKVVHPWDSTRTLKGVSYLHVVTSNDHTGASIVNSTSSPVIDFTNVNQRSGFQRVINAPQRGQPGFDATPEIEFVVEGAKFTYPGVTQPTYTNNTAAIYWYVLTHILGVPEDRLIRQSFLDAIPVCDELITITEEGNTSNELATFKKYTTDMILDTDMSVDDIIRQLDWCMQGHLVNTNGKIAIAPGNNATTHRGNIERNDLETTGEAIITPIRQERYNRLFGGMILQDSENGYTETELPTVVDNTLLARDNGQYLDLNVGVIRGVNNFYHAVYLQQIFANRHFAREQYAFMLSPGTTGKFLDALPGDRVTYAIPDDDSELLGHNKNCYIRQVGYPDDDRVALTLTPYEGAGFYLNPEEGRTSFANPAMQHSLRSPDDLEAPKVTATPLPGGFRLEVERPTTNQEAFRGTEVEGVPLAWRDNTELEQFAYRRTETEAEPSINNGANAGAIATNRANNDFVPDGWGSSPLQPTETEPYVWRITRTRQAEDQIWTQWESPLSYQQEKFQFFDIYERTDLNTTREIVLTLRNIYIYLGLSDDVEVRVTPLSLEALASIYGQKLYWLGGEGGVVQSLAHEDTLEQKANKTFLPSFDGRQCTPVPEKPTASLPATWLVERLFANNPVHTTSYRPSYIIDRYVDPNVAQASPGPPRNPRFLTESTTDTELVLDWEPPNTGGAVGGYEIQIVEVEE